LSVVVGFVHLLLNQVLGKLTPEQQKVLQTVYRNSEELLQLVENVLWLTTLNTGDAEDVIDEFDVRTILRDARQRHEALMADKRLSLTIDVPDHPLVIASDRMKIERAFQNIFNNAVKFTTEGSVQVSARRSGDGNGVDIEVADTGVGIEKTKLTAVLEPFQQVEGAVERACDGLGLGLTVAYRITRMLGGALYIQSQPGAGTTVKLKIPSRGSMAQPDRTQRAPL
jgi:signal transduction histidine kinase